MRTARAFWITGKRTGEIRSADLAPPGPDEVLVETLYSGISRGTESLVFDGRVPAEEAARMRAPFQEGDFPWPVKYGYINVGRVIDGRADLIGAIVFTLFPHQTRFVAPATAVTVVPSQVPPARAVLAANLETAVNALWDAAPRIGDRIAVIGAGTVGCLVAWMAGRIPGTQIELIDIDPAKAAVAAALGIEFRTPDAAGPGADLLLHASGNPAGLDTAIALAGFEATIVELSWYGQQRADIALGQAFHSQRLTLKSSQVGHVATAQRARWDYRRRSELVMRLLEAPELDALISGESAFETLPATLATLADSAALCHRITYS